MNVTVLSQARTLLTMPQVISPMHNKDIVPTAKMLRKNMTKEEKHLWYDFLRTHPVRFSRQKVLGK